MKTKLILTMASCMVLSATAQSVTHEQGLYKTQDGSLYTGLLETMEDAESKAVLEIRDGQRDGLASYYYGTSTLMETGHYEKGIKSGTWRRYNEKGGIIAVGTFLAGRKHGAWLVFDDNGRKTFEMHYHNGEKTGVWYNWDDSGHLINSRDYGSAN